MRPTFAAKTTPGVVNGHVERKQRLALTPSPYQGRHRGFELIRERPGAGHKHLVTRRELETFLELLPDWERLTRGLKAVVLASADSWRDGYYLPGVVHLCAWPRSLWTSWSTAHYREHRGLIERLGIPTITHARHVECCFTEGTARAWSLLHVLVHELGHHHDRMTTATRAFCARGEPFAEFYALRQEEVLFARYVDTFGFG